LSRRSKSEKEISHRNGTINRRTKQTSEEDQKSETAKRRRGLRARRERES